MFKNKMLKTNIIFWTCFFLYEWLANAAYDSMYERNLVSAALLTPLVLCATLFTLFVLIEKLYLKGRKAAFWLWLIVSMLVFGLTRRYINYYILYATYTPNWMKMQPFLLPVKILFEIVGTYLIVALYSMFYFIQKWYKEQQLAQEYKQDKVEAQLELLKSQVQPHFIFNTLNNIYSLSTQNSPKTSDLIYRLSSLLSYTLYDSRKTIIPWNRSLNTLIIILNWRRYGMASGWILQ
ncbi:histidine kinase [Paraflavitalea speifideaquila]|uniref:histidine kinase n=1 Tax=Paraflavitalea speifideaquila TaxID=3076558 RepID=UPI0028E82338|nr:histidine kinase [Paraflavitalea speifideiaquila]